MKQEVRTRFAPSPTGYLHVGGLRTALYDFLFAKKMGGKFILRIEDTDQKREVAGAVEKLIETLKWAGLTYDEGPEIGGTHAPYFQSKRLDLYKKHADLLVQKGVAYLCFCTPERLENMRKEQEAHKRAPKYDRRCLNLKPEEIISFTTKKTPFVVRQKIPNRAAKWNDLVRGEVSFMPETIDDQVLIKSDGYATYHLASVVDDHDMQITHVIRGEEWLSSTPKHLFLYETFGWKAPEFAHLPLLLNKDRSKLSKRQGDVAVEDYRAKGYLPEALLNFVALLGWHPGGDETNEIFTLKELTEKFSFEKVHRGGAVFDLEKLDWMNWQWRKKKFDEMPGEKSEKLLSLCSAFIPAPWQKDKKFLLRALTTIEEKILKNPREAEAHLSFYFKEPFTPTPELIVSPKMKVDGEIGKKALNEALAALEALSDSDFTYQESIKACLLKVVLKLGFKNGQVFWPVRVAVTGEAFSPGVFEVLWALGKKSSIERIKKSLKNL